MKTRTELALLGLLACGTPDPAEPCLPSAIVTDIDETLTISDNEFLMQLADGSYDPIERPDAMPLMQGYADRGFQVVYVTARGQDLMIDDGRTSTQATSDWLDAHGYPRSPNDLYLAEGFFVTGDDARRYKASVVEDLLNEMSIPWGYGNAETDIDGFRDGGVDPEGLFLVGELAGTMGVTGIPDEEAYTAHLPHLETVDAACTP